MLKIRVISQGGRPPVTPVEVCLDRNGGTIGRLKTNHLVLSDPERHVSRVHARIVHGAGGYFVLREGGNPMLLNGQPLNAGDQALLRDGDELAVSTYRLRVSLMERGAGSAPEPSIPPTSLADGATSGAPSFSVAPESAEGGGNVEDSEALTGKHAIRGDKPGSRSALYFSWETDIGPYRTDAAKASSSGDSARPAAGPGRIAGAVGGHAEKEARATSSVDAPRPQAALPALQAFLDAPLTRHALDTALQRFSPANLEHRLRHRTMLDSVLSINRKARLWDLFGSLYAEIARETRDEIRGVLLREFTRMQAEQAQPSMANKSDEGKS